MPKRIANTQLNARSIDILNVIRQNASYAYQQSIPVIDDYANLPKVGEMICGNATFSNEFINALVNRIALVVVQSATFNNPYRDMKKGFLEMGESIEDVFVGIIKAQDFSVEKAPAREFKRNLPDVHSVFHTMNFRVLYPVTIQREDLKRAFLTEGGLEEMITKILDQVYTSASYDEWLLFKYMLIKNLSAGKAYPVAFDSTDMKKGATAFRATSNKLLFMSDKYNEAGVKTVTPRERQRIFMDADFDASFDVEVLASAFNMDKAQYLGQRVLIDDFTSFDNERFEAIREVSDNIEEVTAAELALMADVKAVLVDENWFQIYDNENIMTDTPVNSGLYWNYFYHTWKTVSHSPFANMVVFVDDGATITDPATLTFTVGGVVTSDTATVVNLVHTESDTLANTNYEFVQDEDNTELGVAVTRYGTFMIPEDVTAFTPIAKIGNTGYTGTELTVAEIAVGDTVTLTKDA